MNRATASQAFVKPKALALTKCGYSATRPLFGTAKLHSKPENARVINIFYTSIVAVQKLLDFVDWDAEVEVVGPAHLGIVHRHEVAIGVDHGAAA